jgi:hypothetical protein
MKETATYRRDSGETKKLHPSSPGVKFFLPVLFSLPFLVNWHDAATAAFKRRPAGTREKNE